MTLRQRQGDLLGYDHKPGLYIGVVQCLNASKEMFGTISHELEVNVPATEAWKLYGTLQLSKLVEESLPDFFSKISVLQGDGSAGTILELFFPPGTQDGITTYKETFTVVDDEKCVKVAEAVEGGFLDLGFTLYRTRIEILEKQGVTNQCIAKGTIEYEVKDEFAYNASLVSTKHLASIMSCATDYLHSAKVADNDQIGT